MQAQSGMNVSIAYQDKAWLEILKVIMGHNI
jgi:hypothetical protein